MLQYIFPHKISIHPIFTKKSILIKSPYQMTQSSTKSPEFPVIPRSAFRYRLQKLTPHKKIAA